MIAKFVRSSTIEYIPDISKEYLDKKLDKLATKDDLKGGFKSLEGSLKLHVEKEVGKLAVMTAKGFEEIKKELDVRKEVENPDRRMARIEQALDIKS